MYEANPVTIKLIIRSSSVEVGIFKENHIRTGRVNILAAPAIRGNINDYAGQAGINR